MTAAEVLLLCAGEEAVGVGAPDAWVFAAGVFEASVFNASVFETGVFDGKVPAYPNECVVTT